MVLETSWGTRSGWIIVRDVLLIGPWHHESERSHTHRRAPTDYDADHVLLRTVRCVNGEVQMHWTASRCSTTAAAARAGSTTATGTTRRSAPAADDDVELRLTSDLSLGFEGSRARRAHDAERGRHRVRRAGLERARGAADHDEAYHRLVWTADYWQHWLDARRVPRPPVALATCSAAR